MLLSSRAPVQPAPGRGRAFTLLELVIVAVLSGVVVIAGARITQTIFATGQTSVAQIQPQREAFLISSQLRRDLAAARSCSPYGLDSPFITLTATSLVFTADVNSDSFPDQVTYALNGSVLSRGVLLGTSNAATAASGSDPCVFAGTPTMVTVSEMVDPVPSTSAAFTGWISGAAQTSAATCRGAIGVPDACLYDTVRVHLRLRSAGPHPAITDLNDYDPVNLTRSKL